MSGAKALRLEMEQVKVALKCGFALAEPTLYQSALCCKHDVCHL